MGMFIQLRSLSHDRLRLREALRNYLQRHKISAQLSVRVKTYMELSLAKIQEQDNVVDDLWRLPANLVMDLHLESRAPILEAYGLFVLLRSSHPRALRQV